MRPTLKLKSLLILAEIAEYIQEYDARGTRLLQSASDVCDGSYTRDELYELIHKKILSVCPHDEYPAYIEKDDPLCGSCWTVDFTTAAAKYFWPGRVNERVVIARRISKGRVRKRRKQVRDVFGAGSRRSPHNREETIPRWRILPR